MTWFPDSSRINCSMCTLICSLVTLATSYFFEKLPTPSRNYVPLIQIWSMVRISWKINLFVIIILHSVCDPVMGDHGEMYVPETLLPIYQNEIIPLCDICTPNQYEVELLTGSKVCSVSDAWTAMQWFHEQGVKTVALSSTDLGPADGLLAFVSHKSGEFLCNKKSFIFTLYCMHYQGNDHTRLSITIPKQGNGINFTGTGDLFASLFLAHSTLSHDLKSAFENTIASLQSVIFNTIQRMPPHLIKVEARHRELKIVQSKRELEAPQVKLRAKFVQGGDDCWLCCRWTLRNNIIQIFLYIQCKWQ